MRKKFESIERKIKLSRRKSKLGDWGNVLVGFDDKNIGEISNYN